VVAVEVEDPAVGHPQELSYGKPAGGEHVGDRAQCRVDVVGGAVADEDDLRVRVRPPRHAGEVAAQLEQGIAAGVRAGQARAGGEHGTVVREGEYDDAAVVGLGSDQVGALR